MKFKTRFSTLLAFLLCTQTWVFSQISHASTGGDPYNSYRWDGEEATWFEWWYYKVVLPETRQAYYFVYGVVNPGDTAEKALGTRSYVGFGDFKNKFIIDEKRSVADFHALANTTFVNVGTAGTATDRHLTGQIHNDTNAASWDLSMKPEWRFNGMGWGMFVDFISSVYWYPAQASAVMNGWIDLQTATGKHERIEVKNAPAYQDRNWGRSFPKWWTWLVSNHFKNSPGTVLAGGGGRPKIFNRREVTDGLVFGLRHEGKEYSFRTTDGDRVRSTIDYGVWEVTAQNRSGDKIIISAYAPESDFLDLPFATPEGKTFHDYEALLGKMNVRLYHDVGWFSENWKLVADLNTDEAGIEYGSFTDFGQKFREGEIGLLGKSTELNLTPAAVFHQRQVVFDSEK